MLCNNKSKPCKLNNRLLHRSCSLNSFCSNHNHSASQSNNMDNTIPRHHKCNTQIYIAPIRVVMDEIAACMLPRMSLRHSLQAQEATPTYSTRSLDK